MRASLTRRRVSLRALFLAVSSVALLDIAGFSSKALAACGTHASSPLQRQLAAIQKIERQRRCSHRSTSGFFNACRDLAWRRLEVQKAIISGESSSGRACGSKERPRTAKRQKRPDRPQIAHAAPAALFCVRLSDGYFFPAPKSQFAEVDKLAEAADQCRFICQDRQVELFQLASLEYETADMTSVETGQKYTKLVTAFKYRETDEFEGCNHKRYFQRVNELRARSVTPNDLTNTIIPLPTFRPTDAVAELDAENEGAVAGVSFERTGSIRSIRVVGVPFLPE
jgi:hypothetical protein